MKKVAYPKSFSWKITATALLVLFFFGLDCQAQDCKNGYTWKPSSGVGCVQTNCNDVPDAHWGYVGDCVCGSSGSINENPNDPNKACRYPNDHEACPGCVYACVHAGEDCPNVAGDKKNDQIADPPLSGDIKDNVPDKSKMDKNENKNKPSGQAVTSQSLATGAPLLTTQNDQKRTCQQECEKFKRGGAFYQVVEASGKYPKCKCQVDIMDDKNRLISTVSSEGDRRTIHEFDPNTGALIRKNTISLEAEKERIREQLGYKYTEEEIDALLDDDKINQWFEYMMNNVDTETKISHPQFWWQHIVALWDHGFGNSADFVDTYRFGRCGDSMQWLENNLTSALNLSGKNDNKSEAVLSITGEKYGNFINHTALMVRLAGINNFEWAEMVKDLMAKSGGKGLSASDLSQIDPRLLDAKVLDPYFQKVTTVRKFIKGWSVLKIS